MPNTVRELNLIIDKSLIQKGETVLDYLKLCQRVPKDLSLHGFCEALLSGALVSSEAQMVAEQKAGQLVQGPTTRIIAPTSVPGRRGVVVK